MLLKYLQIKLFDKRIKINTDHIFRFFCPSGDPQAGLLVPLGTEEKIPTFPYLRYF
jgi:hypothetical protein